MGWLICTAYIVVVVDTPSLRVVIICMECFHAVSSLILQSNLRLSKLAFYPSLMHEPFMPVFALKLSLADCSASTCKQTVARKKR